MTTPSPEMPSEEQINAYLDDELSPQARLVVEEAINRDASLRARLQLDTEINKGLHKLFAPALDAPLPARLINAIGPRPWPWWQRACAAAACVCLGVLIGWNLYPLSTASQLAMARPVSAEAAAAHAVFTREGRHAVEVRSDEREHLDRWLSKRLAHKLIAPDLRNHGLKLMGGRLLPDAGNPAAQYMYEDADGERVTIYVRAQANKGRSEALRFEQDRGLEVVHWSDQQMSYAITGKLARSRLQQLASTVHEQM